MTAAPSLAKGRLKALAFAALAVALLAWAASVAWTRWHGRQSDAGLIKGNGRIEATEIDVATKLGGRVRDILVRDGDMVRPGQVLGHMQVDTLIAQREEANAQRLQCLAAVDSALAQVAARDSDRLAALAMVEQRASELDAATRRRVRTETLARAGAASFQELDDDNARVSSSRSALAASQAQANAAAAALGAARTQVEGVRATVRAAEATVARIDADIADSTLVAPAGGRVQYRMAQPGEVLSPGGRVLNMVDLSDVYMTFFVPETVAGRLALGGEVRIVLDAAPGYVFPARVSYVASTAQFTPKTVETASERQKLMFRVKAQLPLDLLERYVDRVKTGLPGVAWVRTDLAAPWPPRLAVTLPDLARGS